jgi:hypothetical protein
VSVSNLVGLTTYYVTLSTVTSQGTVSSASTFTTAPVYSTIIYPAPGQTGVPPVGSTFSWTAVSDAQSYYLKIGSAEGLEDIFNGGENTGTSQAIPNLQPNTLYYLRIATKIAGHWNNYYNDSTFTTAGGTAYITFPSNGATNVDPYLTLTWTTVTNAESYSFVVGTAPGGSDVYSSGSLVTTSSFVPGLNINTTYYVTLSTTTSGGTTTSSISFTTGTGIAHITNVPNGATNVDPFAPFTWNAIVDAQNYYLKIGTQPSVIDTMNTGALSTTITSMRPQGLLGGQTYYVTLSTLKAGIWYTVTTSFTTAVQPMPTNITTYHATILSLINQVRTMTVGITNTPLAGTLLAQYVAADNRTIAYCTEYSETLEELLLENRIFARRRNSVFNGVESHAFNEYYDVYANQWVLVDADFGAMYTNTSLAQLEVYVAARNWTAISGVIVYATSYGDQVFTNYYMDPILLFLNPVAYPSGVVTLPLANSPVSFFQTDSPSVVGTAGLYVFSFVNQTDVLTLKNPTNAVQLTPQNGTIYSNSIILKSGWSITSMPSGAEILTIPRVMF